MEKEKKNSMTPRAQPKSNNTREMLTAGIRAAEGEGKERNFILSFSSEEPVKRWFGEEILEHTSEAVDLKRINDIGCLLYNHNRDKVLGKVTRAWVEGYKAYAEVRFDEDDESEIIFQKVKNKTLQGVSVGYRVDVWEEVKANCKSTCGRFNGPCEIAKRWWPYEISIVSVPADASVGVGREINEEEVEESRSLAVFERQIQINKNILGGK